VNKIPSSAPPTSGPRPQFKNEGKLVPKTKAPRELAESSIRPQEWHALIAFVRMASSPEREAVAEFVRSLYELGGFESWGEYARESGFLASQVSDYKRSKNAPSGPNLLRLIQAATDRAPLAMREAAERTSPLGRVLVRLEALEGRVGDLPTKQEVTEGLDTLREAIGRVASRDNREGHPPTAEADGP